jgi:DNA-binding response OmpR family regulator
MDSSAAPRTLLLVEDDPALALGLRDTLAFEGFRVLHADSGEAGLVLSQREHPDCIILDLMLPGMNGYQVCQAIRAHDHLVPIIMLTARAQEADKIRGLDAGADDYVTKPFSVGELVARVRAALRRVERHGAPTPANGSGFSIGHVTVDPVAHTVLRDGQTITISFYEAELLRLLHRRIGEPVSRDEILEKVWGAKAHQPNNRTVDNFVVKLRKKIEPNHDKPRHILTVYGYGYKLVP